MRNRPSIHAIAVCLCAVLCIRAALGAEPRVIPAVNQPPTDKVGERHYCFEKRTPTRPATFTFDDLSGWTVALFGKAEGAMIRTREAQIWSTYVAKISFNFERRSDRIECRPPKPIPLPNDFDCVNVWVRTDKWYVYSKPPIWNRLTLRLRDAGGEEHLARMGSFPWKDWFLAHRRLIRPPYDEPGTIASGGDGNGRIDMPATLEAIIVEGGTNGKTAALYLDHVSFYREQLKPLKLDPPPKNPFPTTPDTILPTCHAKHECRETSSPTGPVFTYRGEDGTLVYRVNPKKPGFSGVTAQWQDGPVFQPMAGGGPELVGAKRDETLPVDDPSVTWETLEAGSHKNGYRVRWRMSAGDRSATGVTTYHPRGKSLVVDVTSKGGQIGGVSVGRYEGPMKPELVRVPFLSMQRRDPHVLCAGNVFASAFIDWYVTDASTLHGGGEILSATSARYNGGSRYLPTTDGKRNDAHERIFLTVSPRFDEVLPNIPNPPNPHAKKMIHRAWWDVGRADMRRIRQMYRWGLRSAMMEYNGVIWEGGTDFIRRAFYADGGINEGREEMAQFSRDVRGLGYLFGLHTDFCIIPPGVFRCWHEDMVTFTSDGEWRQGWGRCYAVKVSRAEEIARKYAQINKDCFGTCCGYSDVTTSWAPWGNVDYDVRVPMAGKLRGQFEAYARMLRLECDIADGPVISEGPHQWFYAGMPAGNYGQMSRGDAYKRTMLVDFDQLKIHPLQCDVGIGMVQMFYGRKLMPVVRKVPLHSDWFDRWIAWTLAVGHIAQLGGPWGNAGLLKGFYMVQPAQQHYALVPVRRIRYFNGKELVSTGDAIRSGAVKRSQVCVEYTNNLTVFVNGSRAEDWRVNAAGRAWLLPPAGFLLHRPGEFLEHSSLVGPRRIDYVESRNACYLDGRGTWTNANVLATDGAAACFRDNTEEGVFWVVPAMTPKTIAFRPQHFGLQGENLRITAYDIEEAMGDVAYTKMGDKIAIRREKGVAAYRVAAGGQAKATASEAMPESPPVEFVISPRRWVGVPQGEAVEAKGVVFARDGMKKPIELTVLDGRGQSHRHVLEKGGVQTAPITLIPDDKTLTVAATCGGRTVRQCFAIRAEPVEPVAIDLMDPRVHYTWGYCRRGGTEHRPRESSGPGPARFTRATASCGGKKRAAFAAPPVFDKEPHGYVFGEFGLTLPDAETELAFGIGINETSPSPDGVVFSIELTDEQGQRHELFKAHHGDGPWRDERISLAPYAGQCVRLRFQTDCGPREDASGDSARWAEPRIVYRTPRYNLTLE